MFTLHNNKAFSRLLIVVWILLALVAIEGFFLLRKHSPVTPVARKPKIEKVAIKQVKPPVTPPQVHPQEIKKAPGTIGRIAIVIDDWGYNNSHCRYLASMPAPVGVAILPGQQFSHDIIDCAVSNGKFPMLHLPLEPHNLKEIYDRGYVLTTEMSEASLKKTLTKILDGMKGVVGVNNHTGSKGSESDLIMTTVLTEVRKRGLFYVDSMTSDRSVGGKVAARIKMHIAKRDVFLDNRNERGAIERQFAETARIAKENGYALAIGHDRQLSLQIITEQIKKLSEEGYEFISPIDYIKKNEYPRY